MNWEEVRTNWSIITKQLQSKWGKLTEADLKAIGGSRSELVSRLQKLYSFDKVKAEKEAEDFVKTIH